MKPAGNGGLCASLGAFVGSVSCGIQRECGVLTLAGLSIVLLPTAAMYQLAGKQNEQLFAQLQSSSGADLTGNLHDLLNSWTCSSNCQIRIL
jgi:hypothetical protein